MSEPKRYGGRHKMALGQLYMDHVMAMTAEGLHSKSDIAAELAWRDSEIARLQALLDTNTFEVRLTVNQAGEYQAMISASKRQVMFIRRFR